MLQTCNRSVIAITNQTHLLLEYTEVDQNSIFNCYIDILLGLKNPKPLINYTMPLIFIHPILSCLLLIIQFQQTNSVFSCS